MASPTGKPITFRQIRDTARRSRPMSSWDGFLYNFLTMGVIFPWMYLWGPAAFPNANLEKSIILTLIAQLPISLAYSFLASILPVSGGDYIYQTRAFGKWGFVSVMSGFVIWILQWVALSGWLFATLGLAPLLLSLGVRLHSSMLVKWGILLEHNAGIACISLLLALITVLFLNRGLRPYVRIQRWLFVFTAVSIAVVMYVFHSQRGTFNEDLNSFVRVLANLGANVPNELVSSFVTGLYNNVSPSASSTSGLLATLGVVPIAWTSLQWATYSVEQNTEISSADRFAKQVKMVVMSPILVAICLIFTAHYLYGAASHDFLNAAAVAYWDERGSAGTVQFIHHIFQPFPNILAMAICRSPVLVVIISLGFLANAFQIACNSFIGISRILVAMGADGTLPPKLGLSKVDPIRHAPIRAQWIYLIASVPVILGSSFIDSWKTLAAAGVTFACGYVFVLTCLAATRIPSSRMRSFWLASEIHWIPSIVFKAAGYLGAVLGGAMLVAYLTVPRLRLSISVSGYVVVLAVVLLSYLLYLRATSQNPRLEENLKQVPYESPAFYGDVS